MTLFDDASFTERQSFKNFFYTDRPFTRNVHWSNSHHGYPSYISDRLEREKLGFFVRRVNASHFTLRTAIRYYELHESMKLVVMDGRRVFGMYANKVDRMRARPPALLEKKRKRKQIGATIATVPLLFTRSIRYQKDISSMKSFWFSSAQPSCWLTLSVHRSKTRSSNDRLIRSLPWSCFLA